METKTDKTKNRMKTLGNQQRTDRWFRACLLMATTILTVNCANDNSMPQPEQKENGGKVPAGATVFSGETQAEATTRTAIVGHTKGSGAAVTWSVTDKICVKDNGGTWQQSGTAVFPAAAKASHARFALTTGVYGNPTHDVVYTNKPIDGKQPQVEIKTQQTQSAANNFDHAGESGDCAIATATANDGVTDYDFTLDHKASYLCLIPRSSNAYVHRSKLTKIEIVSDDDIAGTYNIATDGTLTLASGGSRTITLTTGSGFELDNTTDDMGKNASYVVIAPGTHALRIRYWLKNTVDGFYKPYYMGGQVQPIEGTITKYVTMDFKPGKMQDITSNLDFQTNNDYKNYYMWDAKQNYWWQHEWNPANPSDPNIWQPTFGFDGGNPNYPTASDPDRYYNPVPIGSAHIYASNSCAICPNTNELEWYAQKGNPHWDDELWLMMGHLFRGRLWLKKKAKIAFDNSTTESAMAAAAPNGVNMRDDPPSLESYNLSHDLPKISELNDYFYLYAAGYYLGSQLYMSDYWQGTYWSSDGHHSFTNYACFFNFTSTEISIMSANNTRNYGHMVKAFE